MYSLKVIRLVVGLVTVIALLFSNGSVFSQESEKSLYERLGGIQGIALVVSDFMDDFMEDEVIFANPEVKERKTSEAKPYIRYGVISMVCEATGGPCQYTGKDMKAAHDGLNVTEREWDRMVEILANTLAEHNVPEQETQELFEILGTTKDDIVFQGGR